MTTRETPHEIIAATITLQRIEVSWFENLAGVLVAPLPDDMREELREMALARAQGLRDSIARLEEVRG